MEENGGGFQLWVRVLYSYACFVAIWLAHCDATKISPESYLRSPSIPKLSRKFYLSNKFDTYESLDSSNTGPYVSSPFSLPPYESLPPFPQPENAPPYCVCTNPPLTPQPPSTIPSPAGDGGGYMPPSPPATSSVPTSPIPTTPGPPSIVPNPPTNVPAPTTPSLSPPYYEPSPPGSEPTPPYYEPTPPYYEPSPPGSEPSPPGSEPSPPYIIPSPSGSNPSPSFLPPIVYPPPAVPPPPRRVPLMAQWCVAKASVPDPIIQEAMNYACGSGADCDQIQPSGSCFQPDTLFAHASYAFNSFWQRTKMGGGTCDFGGTAILVTVDPSYDGCHFIYA